MISIYVEKLSQYKQVSPYKSTTLQSSTIMLFTTTMTMKQMTYFGLLDDMKYGDIKHIVANENKTVVVKFTYSHETFGFQMTIFTFTLDLNGEKQFNIAKRYGTFSQEQLVLMEIHMHCENDEDEDLSRVV